MYQVQKSTGRKEAVALIHKAKLKTKFDNYEMI